jgi:thioredoxin-related protein
MIIYKNITLLLTSVLLTLVSFGQIKQVKFEELDSLQKVQKRPVFVFLHTTWCRYCSSMKNITLKNNEVISLVNQKFYYVSLDIEDENDITFRGYTFKYKPTGPNTGVHDLAEQLGSINGELAYPTISFLNAEYEIIYQQEGFIREKEFLDILKKLH